MTQLRYDLNKLRAKGLVERIGKTRRYRVTPLGVKLGILLIKARTLLLGPLSTLATEPHRRLPTRNPSRVEAAMRKLDADLNEICQTLGLTAA
ncbi:MAG: hypothetical protein GEU75_10775 [Dehalococcoidia bacterium]|nr:hypothetical protein [Dehalococcoidia bacterium]